METLTLWPRTKTVWLRDSLEKKETVASQFSIKGWETETRDCFEGIIKVEPFAIVLVMGK